jgi:hypothetical protein
MSAAKHAAIDQAVAAAREAVAPTGGKIVDTRDALLTVVVDQDGHATFTATTSDLRWVADSLALLARTADARAAAAGQ